MAEADGHKWNERYLQGWGASEPSSSLLSLSELLPTRGRALDVAGGNGRHAIWLAQRGLQPTLVDISSVAIAQAAAAAEAAGLHIDTARADVEAGQMPPGPWELILVVNFLWRPLFRHAADLLSPGGTLVVIHPTRTNLQRHSQPRPARLLEPSELSRLVGAIDALRIVHYDESWQEDGRHEARVVAVKASSDGDPVRR